MLIAFLLFGFVIGGSVACPQPTSVTWSNSHVLNSSLSAVAPSLRGVATFPRYRLIPTHRGESISGHCSAPILRSTAISKAAEIQNGSQPDRSVPCLFLVRFKPPRYQRTPKSSAEFISGHISSLLSTFVQFPVHKRSCTEHNSCQQSPLTRIEKANICS